MIRRGVSAEAEALAQLHTRPGPRSGIEQVAGPLGFFDRVLGWLGVRVRLTRHR
jgi:hypothetical protein